MKHVPEGSNDEADVGAYKLGYLNFKKWVASLYPIKDEKVELLFSEESPTEGEQDTVTNIDAAENQVANEAGVGEHVTKENAIEEVADEAEAKENADEKTIADEDVNKGESLVDVSKYMKSQS